jgi:hypothetical protein
MMEVKVETRFESDRRKKWNWLLSGRDRWIASLARHNIKHMVDIGICKTGTECRKYGICEVHIVVSSNVVVSNTEKCFVINQPATTAGWPLLSIIDSEYIS